MARHPVIALTLVALGSARDARADHDHHTAAIAHTPFAARLSLVVGRFDTRLYEGHYEGAIAAVAWSFGRGVIGVSAPAYLLSENGRDQRGLGDVTLDTQWLVIRRTVTVGIALAVSLPTGDSRVGLGMGHPMAMPAVWAQRRFAGRVMTGAMLGFGGGLGDGSAHQHGSWPLVSPMNRSEITASGSAMVSVGSTTAIGARVTGGLPVATEGTSRAIVAGRALWTRGRIISELELQAAVVGDRLLRAVAQTTVGF